MHAADDATGPWTLAMDIPTTPTVATHLLNANHRTHWRVRARLTRRWRDTASLVATSAMNRGDLPRHIDSQVHVEAVFAFGDNRRRDVANLYPTVKACVDGLVDAGLIVDDDDQHLVGPDMRRGEQDGVGPSITLLITELINEGAGPRCPITRSRPA